MAPGLVRPHGPERRATAQALNTAAAYADTRGTGEGHARARAAAAAAVQVARQSLLSAGNRPTTRRALRALVVRAEVALAAPTETDPARLRARARERRGARPVPYAGGRDGEELSGVDLEPAAPRPPLWRALAPLGPIAARTALGCALADYASLAFGLGRPHWALVTASALYQADVTLTWNRAVQRVVGNLVGVLVFAALVPLVHLGRTVLVPCCLACRFGAEALISRNYWLGSVCVTPMALLITEFTGFQNPGALIAERVVDTFVGALVGFAAAVAVTNRSAGARLEPALTATERVRERTARLPAEPQPTADALGAVRRALAAALVELRATADAASGEWWPRALPQERVVAAEQAGHRTLAATLRRQGLLLDQDADRTTEDARP
ncbi:hypothetical protein GCM10010254_18910 [Streptomyces chromofuscus]|nr:hypothetical protein GCM10010254_18910 [Streptomyces chromofuscus]